MEVGTIMRIQYVSRLTEKAAAQVRAVAPILVVAGGTVPLPSAGKWEHVISVSESRKVVDVGGLRFITMPYSNSAPDVDWLLRELSVAQTDLVPTVCASWQAPVCFLGGDAPFEYLSRSLLLRVPMRAWIIGETPTGMNRVWRGRYTTVQVGSNPFGAPGYCGEIFLDVSTEAVQEVPLLLK
jgi:hypothetical protein